MKDWYMAMRKHRYTPEQDEWLRQHIEHCNSYRQLTEMFNEHFSVSVGKYSISDRCIKQLHIHRNVNTGTFQKGEQRAKTYRIGDERVYSGYVWVKVNDIQHSGKITIQKFNENWMPKQRYVYEQHHGKIPDGHIVVFLDSNPLNFSTDNLYCIPRRINAIMNQNHWFTTERENTLTAIKWCELYYALKGATT